MSFELSKNLITDFFGYLVFVLSCYIAFGTELSFRYFLIPLTLIAFFLTIYNRYSQAFQLGFSSCQDLFQQTNQFLEGQEEND
jgi:hypothetical protein